MKTLLLKVMTGEVVEFTVVHQSEVGLQDNSLIAPGSGETEVVVYTGFVENQMRTLLIQNDGTGAVNAYLLHKAPYDVEVIG